MMHKSVSLLASTLLITTLVFVPYVSASVEQASTKHSHKGKQEQGGEKHHMMRKFKKMAKYLQLSEDQRTQAKTIFSKAEIDKKNHREVIKDFKEQVKHLMNTPAFDEKAFTELHQQYQPHFSAAALSKAKKRHALFQILTEEQKEKLVKKKGKRHQIFSGL
jgi:protein CpxP